MTRHGIHRTSLFARGCCIGICLLLSSFAVINTHAAGTETVDEALRRIEQLQEQDRLEAAYALCDSLHKSMNEEFRKQYDEAIVPVRLEYNSEEMKMEADKERNNLILRVCLLALVVAVAGLGLYFFIRKQNRRVAESAKAMADATHQAEIAERSKSMFLSNMTHEIRTPLNAISGFSEVLSMEGVGDEFYGEAAEIIEMNSKLLQNLIDDVVETACLDLTEMKFRIAPCDIVKLSRNVTEMISKMGKTEAVVSFDSPLPHRIINTDALRVQQVLVNVLVNATKFCKQGSIVMSVHIPEAGTSYAGEQFDGSMVAVAVSDTGIGIPKDKQAGVFKRFERVKESAEGFGLGLSICQLIIERLGGKIWVDPEYTGGARFVFILPLNKEVPADQEGAMML